MILDEVDGPCEGVGEVHVCGLECGDEVIKNGWGRCVVIIVDGNVI